MYEYTPHFMSAVFKGHSFDYDLTLLAHLHSHISTYTLGNFCWNRGASYRGHIVIIFDNISKLLAMETNQFESWWSTARSSLDGVKAHVMNLPASTHWKSLTRRSTADSTHVLPGSNKSIDARSIVTLIFFFLISTPTSLS